MPADPVAARASILLVEDDPDLRRSLGGYLRGHGHPVDEVGDAAAALERWAVARPALVLLDLGLPDMDGIVVIRRIRREATTPILIISARDREADKVEALEAGADDYVTKPFGMRELVARIRAVLRRTGQDMTSDEVLRAADIVVDRGSRSVQVGGQPARLTPSEFDLLAVLMAAPGRVLSRAVLLEQLQGGAFEGVERTIDVHVRNLRTKIEPDPSNPRYVETVFGVGYRFRAE
jgi:DNA-binding response OmpR family regulator